MFIGAQKRKDRLKNERIKNIFKEFYNARKVAHICQSNTAWPEM